MAGSDPRLEVLKTGGSAQAFTYYQRAGNRVANYSSSSVMYKYTYLCIPLGERLFVNKQCGLADHPTLCHAVFEDAFI